MLQRSKKNRNSRRWADISTVTGVLSFSYRVKRISIHLPIERWKREMLCNRNPWSSVDVQVAYLALSRDPGYTHNSF